jgi:hypothetical protein
VLENHANDESDIAKLTKTAEVLKQMSISTKSVEALIPPLVTALEKRKALIQEKKNILKKIERFKMRLTQLSHHNARHESKLKTYCAGK